MAAQTDQQRSAILLDLASESRKYTTKIHNQRTPGDYC